MRYLLRADTVLPIFLSLLPWLRLVPGSFLRTPVTLGEFIVSLLKLHRRETGDRACNRSAGMGTLLSSRAANEEIRGRVMWRGWATSTLTEKREQRRLLSGAKKPLA